MGDYILCKLYLSKCVKKKKTTLFCHSSWPQHTLCASPKNSSFCSPAYPASCLCAQALLAAGITCALSSALLTESFPKAQLKCHFLHLHSCCLLVDH